ncbi:DUF5133 domain-containing protein [Streptomyces virginiae]|uniref:DUF5133 domain-containing protein n=1 Tax=Streptomyces virginiae TaxID=1961 RepID=A0ABZ1TPT6_STRVG|nr:DUF5133 domain-containing protein [Streptomyces virginiae]
MNNSARQHSTPVAPTARAGGLSTSQEARAAYGRATVILMALVPCTAATSRRIVADAARSAGAGPDEVAAAVLAMRVGEPVAPAVDEALRRVLADARTLPTPATSSWLPPRPDVLRRHVNHLRAARRRAVAAPDDTGVRGELEDAAYTLCILMEQRSAHAALLAAEELIAVNRLDSWVGRPPQRSHGPRTAIGPGESDFQPGARAGAGPGQGRGVPPVALTISPVM